MRSDKAILIIDDEIDLCLLLKEFFVRRNFSVRIANTVTEGMACLSDFEPNILLLDYNLADGVGWEQAPKIAAHYPEIFIVLMSAYNSTPPIMPPHANFEIIEKPVSAAALSKHFDDIYTSLKRS